MEKIVDIGYGQAMWFKGYLRALGDTKHIFTTKHNPSDVVKALEIEISKKIESLGYEPN